MVGLQVGSAWVPLSTPAFSYGCHQPSGSMALTMATFSRLGTLAACVIATACGGSANVDEIEGSGAAGGAAGSNAGGTAGNTAGDSGGSAGGDDGGAGGTTSAAGTDTGGSGGDATDGGAGGGETDSALFVEDFEDGDTNGWYRGCASMDALPEAAATATVFGAQLRETRAQGCENGWAAQDFSSLTPSRIEWWMRVNSQGEIFGSLQIEDAVAVFAMDGMVVVDDGPNPEDSKIFDVDGLEWHRYELLDIDWNSRTYSFAVDGELLATALRFYAKTQAVEEVYIAAGARDPLLSDPVSVDVDELIFYQ